MDRIRIEIHPSYDELEKMLLVCGIIFFPFYFAMVKSYPTAGGIIFGLLLFIPAIAFMILHDIRPMVIRSNGVTMRYKHLFGMKEIKLCDITALTCEPYSVSTRYGTNHRIKLTIKLSDPDIGEIEFNDAVNASALINEKLDGNSADIPLIRLYEFLKERTNL